MAEVEAMSDLIPSEEALIEEYKALIGSLRNTWRSCLTATGRRQQGPGYYAITRCDDDGNIGMTSAKATKGKRWACKTCVGFAPPIWTDNEKKCPSEDEALHEYTDWAMNMGVKSAMRMQRRRVKRIYQLDGTKAGRFKKAEGS